MDSSTNRVDADRRQKEEIRKQIAQLQAKLVDLGDNSEQLSISSPKRRQTEPSLLVPPTPSPKKRRKISHDRPALQNVNSAAAPTIPPTRTSKLDTESKLVHVLTRPSRGPSNLLTKLASVNKRPVDIPQDIEIQRSSGFTEKPQPVTGVKRDGDLAIIEDLTPGPVDHKPPHDDPHFERLEPNSGIRLSSRIVPHEIVQDHLRGRFYLSPSRLYSCIRLLPNKQAYEVPVPGDWLTIAVVAERGPLKFSKAPLGGEDEDPGKQSKDKNPPPKPTGRKYVNMKLVDFGSRSRTTSGSVTGGKATIRGDAFLTLLLFEADSFDLVSREEWGEAGKGKMKKVYKGGSGGAFEAMAQVKEGDVIAILNSKILKPFQRSNDTPHPISNILALTPTSASSILVLGRARDLGMCTVVKRDGKVCGSWCDKRVSDICEYHVQTSVERRRASRPEFSIGTSGMSTTAVPKRKSAYDPARQWGLAPSEPPVSTTTFASPTYLISGHIISPASMYNSENLGREGQAKAQRQLQTNADRELKRLLEKDREGMRAVIVARETGLEKKSSKAEVAHGDIKAKGKERALAEDGGDGKRRSSYSAGVIKQLGFDPAAKPGQRIGGDSAKQKLEVLASIQSSRQIKNIVLGSRPGRRRVRSGVRPPDSQMSQLTTKEPTFNATANLEDESGSEPLYRTRAKRQILPEGEKMIDLDDL